MANRKRDKFKIIRAVSALLICLFLLCLCACGGPTQTEQKVNEIDFFAMDTYMSIKAFGISEDQLSELESEVKELEKLWSVTDEDSDISRLNKEKEAEISETTAELIDKALSICRDTDGALDITVYPVVKAWGFTTGENRVPTEGEIKNCLEGVDYTKVIVEGKEVSIPDSCEVDLGAVAKGYLGDVLVEELKAKGCTSALLSLGGNIQAIGTKENGEAWKVGIQDPKGNGTLGVLTVSDKAVVTSGGYERYFEDEAGNIWWHIMDPATGYPAKNGLVSVTIVSDSGLYSDALSTAIFVMGKEKAQEFWNEHKDFEMILVTEDGEVITTSGLEGNFSVTE